MKTKSFLILYILFSSAFLFAQTDTAWVIKQTKLLAPEQFQILTIHNDLPFIVSCRSDKGEFAASKNSATYEYLLPSERRYLLRHMGTNVHEINHDISSLLVYKYCAENQIIVPYSGICQYYYLSGSENYYILSTIPFFPSKELVSVMPEENRTSRFATYIDGNSTTQNYGLLGLLDEFNCYYHSLALTWKLRPAYAEATGSEIDGYFAWMVDLRSQSCAYHEFSYYILEYLLFAKEHHPEIYLQIKEDPKYIEVFNAITKHYKEYINKYISEFNIASNFLTLKGYHLEIRNEDTYTVYKNGEIIDVLLGIDQEMLLLKAVVESGRYAGIISELSIVE